MTTLQKNIVKILDRATQDSEIQGVTVLRIINLLKPRDKPPLLSDEEIEKAVWGEWNATHWRVAQAQREGDIKFYS